MPPSPRCYDGLGRRAVAEKRKGRGPVIRGGGRYDPYELVARLERRRIELGVTRVALAAAAGMAASQYTHKTGLIRNQFSTTEYGRMADYLALVAKETLPGWPFISEEQSRLLERTLREKPLPTVKGHLSSIP